MPSGNGHVKALIVYKIFAEKALTDLFVNNSVTASTALGNSLIVFFALSTRVFNWPVLCNSVQRLPSLSTATLYYWLSGRTNVTSSTFASEIDSDASL